jgi:hypothetical protein
MTTRQSLFTSAALALVLAVPVIAYAGGNTIGARSKCKSDLKGVRCRSV